MMDNPDSLTGNDQYSPEQLALFSENYANYRNQNDQGIRLGVFGEDLERALRDPNTIMTDSTTPDGEKVKVPVLVPLNILEWYNTELVDKKFGENTDAYYYDHPPVVDEESAQSIGELLFSKLDDGKVIITDKYADDTDSPIANVLNQAKSGEFTVEAFGGDVESRVDVYASKVSFTDDGTVKNANSLFEVYEESIDNGEYERNPDNGPSLAAVIEGDEAEAIWNIYEKPFDDLGHDDPTYAGFHKEDLLEILKDPNVAKVVNRVDGELTTLLFFLQDFDQAPWFNKQYYQEKYPEYAETNNVFMFPGIVSDESKRGNNYAMDVIDLATNLLGKRDTDILITFECTEVSATYIPKIVTAAVNNSGVGKVESLDKPVSVINYYAVKKN
jgi:hypothetical protein